MNSLFILIPIAIIFVIIAIVIFFWALRNNQYEDLDREAYNILFDDKSVISKKVGVTSATQAKKHSNEVDP